MGGERGSGLSPIRKMCCKVTTFSAIAPLIRVFLPTFFDTLVAACVKAAIQRIRICLILNDVAVLRRVKVDKGIAEIVVYS